MVAHNPEHLVEGLNTPLGRKGDGIKVKFLTGLIGYHVAATISPRSARPNLFRFSLLRTPPSFLFAPMSVAQPPESKAAKRQPIRSRCQEFAGVPALRA